MKAHSWQPVDLAALGNEPPPVASISGLTYPGSLALFYGEPEAVKTWLALVLSLEEIRAGHNACWIDFEMSPHSIHARLLDLGATEAELESFHYLQPSEPLKGEQIEADIAALMATHPPSLVVVDAMAGALALHGLDGNSNADVETFYSVTLAPFRSPDAAVVVVDHVTKDRETRGRWPIGAQRKLGAVDVGLSVEMVKALSRGETGLARLHVRKDRLGALHRPYAAEIELESDPDTGRITWEIRRADADGSGEFVFKPTWYMEQVFAWLKEHGPASRNAVVEGIGRKRAFVLDAIRNLLIEGSVCETVGSNRSKLLSVPSSQKFPEVPGTAQDEETGTRSSRFPSLYREPITGTPICRGFAEPLGTARGGGDDDIPF